MTSRGTRLRQRRSGWPALASFALAALLAGCAAAPEAPAGAHQARDFAALDRFVRREMEAAGVPGLAIAVLRDGRIVHQGAYGVKHAANREPVTPDTLFEAASLSKPVFAAFVVLQAEQGLLDLDRPLYRYLPHPDLAGDPRHRRLTARMVLAHASGLPNWRQDTGGELKFLFEPGTRFGYSGEAYEYLKDVLKHLLGVDDAGLQARLEADVFGPIGAPSMRYTWDASIPARKAYGHRGGTPTDNHRHDDGFGASYTLHATASDYARFLAMLARPGRDRAPAVARLLAIQRDLPHEEGELHRSLGFPVKATARGLRYYHAGNNGDFRAYCHLYPGRGDGVVLFGNADNLFSSGLAQRILERLEEPWFYM
ncbi:serine hydrolase [Luteimonas sp. RD2P54]|uniref:Serine hydrolase n=1 Tax=Luteimonas endophytica TaxID=3042023 RepID=A0ABT6J4F5_9GAMM|nr:serine hydrolase domain-containing protein [Luteimonas endophytica]MDH5821700.1 serine hydrolase [Luteimonas endophytica]